MLQADHEPKRVKDRQPTDGHVLPTFADDQDLITGKIEFEERLTGEPFLSTDGVVNLDGEELEVQSPRQVDIVAGEKNGLTLFEPTSDALSVAEETGFDPRDYKSHPLEKAKKIDLASVGPRQLKTVRKHGASRHQHNADKPGSSRIKGLIRK